MVEQVLVFGARGYIGRVVSRLLSETKKLEPVGIFRRGEGYAIEVAGHVSEFESLESLGLFLKENSNAKTAINAAALTIKDDSFAAIKSLVDANVTLPALIAKVCKVAGVERLVHFGTFSTSMDGATPSPQTFYAATKSAGYEALRYFATVGELKIVVLEPFDIYAADHPHGKIISALVESLEHGRELELSPGEQEMAPVHALDVARSSIRALKIELQSNFVVWSLAGPEIFSLRELVSEIGLALKKERNLGLIKFSKPYRANEIMKVATRHSQFPETPRTRLRQGLFLAGL